MKVHHYGIEVKDMEKSISFFKEALHFQIEEKVKFMNKELVFLQLDHIRLELYLGAEESNRLYTHICFEVPSVKKALEDFLRMGYLIEEGPYQLENGWKTIFLTSPSGDTIEILQTSTNSILI